MSTIDCIIPCLISKNFHLKRVADAKGSKTDFNSVLYDIKKPNFMLKLKCIKLRPELPNPNFELPVTFGCNLLKLNRFIGVFHFKIMLENLFFIFCCELKTLTKLNFRYKSAVTKF